MAEILWDGKYDEHGDKVGPLRVSLPFQTVETVNESGQERQRMLDLFSAGRDRDWRNRLIWGEKKYVLPSLLDEFSGKANLIYIDPPFNVGTDFSFVASIPEEAGGDSEDRLEFSKQQNFIEEKAYRDTWGRGLDSYLPWFHDTVVLLHELMTDNGTLYVHLDWHVGHYAKAVLDEVFGPSCFESQIIWQRVTSHSDREGFGLNHDMILAYAAGESVVWNTQYTPLDDKYVNSHYTQVDEAGRRFRWDNATAAGQGPERRFFGKLLAPPPGTHWRWSQETIDRLIEEGRIELTSRGTPQYKRYLDEMKGKVVQSVWTDIPPVNSQALEDTGYATQKPEALLERIIGASSNEGDLVLDCFCGSGTTAAVAERLNRRWIACDLSRFAVHTTRKRLLSIPGVRPFAVQNLGKYERQAWQVAEFGEKGGEGARQASDVHQAYLEFILQLCGARLLQGYTWIHGLKSGRMVHVGAVDAPVSIGDVSQILAEFKKAAGSAPAGPRGELAAERATVSGVDILGWDFAFDLNEVAKQQAAQTKVDLRFYKIPRDVMDKRAVEQGDIHFFELAALSVEAKARRLGLTLRLTDFVIPPDDVPEEVQRSIRHWSQWVDYWAIDWDFKGDAFHNEWQAYRTRGTPDLPTEATHTYENAGIFTVLVKVIDILGNDTTKALTVKVK